jgi:signal transduction histidine kinase
VEDLLDVSRITHGKIRLHSEVVRLGEVIEAAVDANRALVEASRLHLRVKRPPAELWILGDVVRLTQVFSNLLHNAIKFSVAGGIIEISVRRGEGNQQVSVSVRDEGAGIAPNLIDSVFDLFTQDEQSLARNRGGLGIGLSVVRSLVKLHGGAVSVRSDGVGKGSEFVVALPLACAPIAVTSASAVEPRHGTNQRVLIANGTRDVVEAMRVPLEMGRHAPRLACDG